MAGIDYGFYTGVQPPETPELLKLLNYSYKPPTGGKKTIKKVPAINPLPGIAEIPSGAIPPNTLPFIPSNTTESIQADNMSGRQSFASPKFGPPEQVYDPSTNTMRGKTIAEMQPGGEIPPAPTAPTDTGIAGKAWEGAKGIGSGIAKWSEDPAISRGLLQTGLTMLAQKPSQYPISFAQSLGEGGIAGLGAYDEERQRQAQAAELKRKAGIEEEKLGMERKLFPSQLSEQEAKAIKAGYMEVPAFGTLEKLGPTGAIPVALGQTKPTAEHFVNIQVGPDGKPTTDLHKWGRDNAGNMQYLGRVGATPEDVKIAGAKAFGQSRLAVMRATPMSAYDVIDKRFYEVTKGEVADHPERFANASLGVKMQQKEASFEEIEASSKQVSDILPKIDFTQGQIAKFANALRTDDDGGAISTVLQSEIGKTLTPDEITYANTVKNLRESAYALRGIAGMGSQSSDMLRHAIDTMVPGKGTPSREYAQEALRVFNIQVAKLKEGLAKAGKKTPTGSISDIRTSGNKQAGAGTGIPTGYPTTRVDFIAASKKANPLATPSELDAQADRVGYPK